MLLFNLLYSYLHWNNRGREILHQNNYVDRDYENNQRNNNLWNSAKVNFDEGEGSFKSININITGKVVSKESNNYQS